MQIRFRMQTWSLLLYQTVTKGSKSYFYILLHTFYSCKVHQVSFQNGSGSHLNYCCAPRCVDGANRTRFSSLHIRSQSWLAVRRELITHSQFTVLTANTMSSTQTNTGQHSFPWMNKTTPVIIYASHLSFCLSCSTLPRFCWQPLLCSSISETKIIRIWYLALNDPPATRRSTII